MRVLAKPFLQRFGQDRSGAFAIMFAFMILTVFGAGALALDFGSAYSLRLKVMSALDAAALAGARSLSFEGKSNGQVKQFTKEFIDANLASAGVANLIDGQPKVEVDRQNETVTITASTRLPTKLAGVFGLNALTSDYVAEASMPTKNVEVVFALDFTGSMTETPDGDTQSKFEALRSTVQTSIVTLYDSAIRDDGMRIGFVPWTYAVRLGSGFVNVGTDSTTQCVSARGNWSDLTDTAGIPGDFRSENDADCPVTPMQALLDRSQRSNVETYIADMAPILHMTGGHIGAAWAWYLLSPNWGSKLPNGSKPFQYEEKSEKVVVFMSDGVFNATRFEHGGDNTDKSYEIFQALCANMKAKDITIYTIGFDIGPAGSRDHDELKTCASGDTYFFHAANNAALQSAFSAITQQVMSLRLKK